MVAAIAIRATGSHWLLLVLCLFTRWPRRDAGNVTPPQQVKTRLAEWRTAGARCGTSQLAICQSLLKTCFNFKLSQQHHFPSCRSIRQLYNFDWTQSPKEFVCAQWRCIALCTSSVTLQLISLIAFVVAHRPNKRQCDVSSLYLLILLQELYIGLLGTRNFVAFGDVVLNSLPANLRSASVSLQTFANILKHIYFKLPWAPLPINYFSQWQWTHHIYYFHHHLPATYPPVSNVTE